MIYEPTGKAREYSPLAANLYQGCNHQCKYCFAPGIAKKTREEYSIPYPVSDAVKKFEKESLEMYGSSIPILFCFMSDPYNITEEKYKVTRRCLDVALKHRLTLKILTKSKLVTRDIDLFRQFKGDIKVGMTLTFLSPSKSQAWENGASLPQERLDALKLIHDAGVKTWASFEPVIDPAESISMIKASLPFVDEYKIGKINNYQGLDNSIDWTSFLKSVVEILRGVKPFYVKNDLAAASPSVKLLLEERKHE